MTWRWHLKHMSVAIVTLLAFATFFIALEHCQ